MKILLIDDDQTLRNNLRRVLEKFSYDVVQASSGREGLDILRKAPDVAVVLLDWQMPEMSGIEVLEEINQWNSHPPIMMLSSRKSREDIIKAINLGAVDYILKPMHVGKLVLKINSVVAQYKDEIQQVVDRAPVSTIKIEATSNFTFIDISETGCSFKSSFPIPKDSIVILESGDITSRLSLKEEECFPVRVANCIVEGRSYKIGAQFVGLSSDLQNKLRVACSSVKGFKV